VKDRELDQGWHYLVDNLFACILSEWKREVKCKAFGRMIRSQFGNASKVILRQDGIRGFVVPTLQGA
jgi:hypothetical protein